MRSLPIRRFVVGTVFITALSLLVWGARPALSAQAASNAAVYDLNTTVPVSHVLTPTDPCRESILLNGSFTIDAHVVLPGDPTQPRVYATLHLNGTGVNGIGQTTGASYVGTQGSDQTFTFNTLNPADFQFAPGFSLLPPSPILPTDPCHATVPFSVHLSIPDLPTGDSQPSLSVTLALP